MLSPVDTAVICGLALLLFGPKKFPEIGRALGQGLGNFKKALTEAQDETKNALKNDVQTKSGSEPATQTNSSGDQPRPAGVAVGQSDPLKDVGANSESKGEHKPG